MKRLILLALIAVPLGIAAYDRLESPAGPVPRPHRQFTASFDFTPPEPPAPPELPGMPEPPAPPAPPELPEDAFAGASRIAVGPAGVEIRREGEEIRVEADGDRPRTRTVVIRVNRRGASAESSESKPAPARHSHPDGELGACCLGALAEDEEAGEADPDRVRDVESELMATEERAVASLDEAIDAEVSRWLAEAGLPGDWSAPEGLIRGMVRGEPSISSEDREYGTLYRATVPVAFTPDAKRSLVREYHREVSHRRMAQLGYGLMFVLSCLGLFTGYVRADEATKGYYTGRLRIVALAAAGAAGFALSRFLV